MTCWAAYVSSKDGCLVLWLSGQRFRLEPSNALQLGAHIVWLALSARPLVSPVTLSNCPERPANDVNFS